MLLIDSTVLHCSKPFQRNARPPCDRVSIAMLTPSFRAHVEVSCLQATENGDWRLKWVERVKTHQPKCSNLCV